jgi:hypothetical protein
MVTKCYNELIDKILEKINRHGINNLSIDETIVLKQHSTGNIDTELFDWILSEEEDTYDYCGKKLLFSEFEEGEDIFCNFKKMIRVLSNHFGIKNHYSGSADWGSANVWTINGDKYYGLFIYYNKDEDDLCLLKRTFDESKDENINEEIIKATDSTTFYRLLMKAKTL